MGAYRLEEASTSRAGCQNKECKDAKIKIAKGELRHGSWVEAGDYQSWKWRHWGCVTPNVIENLKDAIKELSGGDETDCSALDGFDELSEENQEKVRRALEQGHVDDEDWKGDVEVNRPGMKGFRSNATKKEAAAKKKAQAKAEEEDEAEPTPKSKKRSRAQPKKESKVEAEADGEQQEQEEAPKPKRSRKSAQPKPVSDEDEEEEVMPKSSKRGRPAKSKAAVEEAAEEPAAAKKKVAKKPTKAAAATADDEEKPKRGRKKKTA
ncbi:zf-PARP-domain-containing protein [Aspergillus indologenus CBS 114.80]|uniref:Zf-PARP-domain-containing protein n=1 Tax=Aspergillus indologenus CBS 114.80 TaxID=1450541 RepID=A0A2V5HMQ5_9EURO|nr:zf-PARP-domain-containing protein [Aspergillus indologenus CBS 114.80]